MVIVGETVQPLSSFRYVEMLERQQKQLVAGLQELYRRTQSGLGWDGPPLKETGHGTPLTHDILERLGALKPSRHNLEAEHFEEDLHSLQRRLLAKGAGSIQRAPSDSGSESDQSPTFYQTSHKPTFGHPFSLNKLPLTPPTQSPYPENTSPALSHENHNESRLSSVQEDADDSMPSRQMWASSNLALDINMDHLSRYDSPVNLDAMPNPFDAEQMLTGTIAPYLSVRDWNRDTDFQSYFSAATM